MTKEDNRYCAGCYYFSSSGSGEEAEDSCCMYIVHKKHRRPDPGGVGCRLHTKIKREKEKIVGERKWNMETAARLLQYGVTGKQVAEAVGVAQSEISRHKDTLMSMEVEPLTQFEAEKLLKKWKPVERAKPTKPQTELVSKSTPVTPAPMPPQQIEETQTAPGSEAPMPDPEESKPVSRPVKLEKPTLPIRKEPNIQVDISIGKGKVHLEADTPRQLVTLVNMLATMIETNED